MNGEIEKLLVEVRDKLDVIENRLYCPSSVKKYTCFDCEYWADSLQKCLKYQAVPPPKIIVQIEKCPSFMLYDIPF